MTDVRAALKARFLNALGEHIKSIIRDQVDDHEMSYVGSTFLTEEELGNALDALLGFEPATDG